jgi:hypothetical protein
VPGEPGDALGVEQVGVELDGKACVGSGSRLLRQVPGHVEPGDAGTDGLVRGGDAGQAGRGARVVRAEHDLEDR